MLKPGLYEKVVSQRIREELAAVPVGRKELADIDHAEAPKILAQYVAQIVESRLKFIGEKDGGIEEQTRLINRMISAIEEDDNSVAQGTKQLLAIIEEGDPKLALEKSVKDIIPRPETSLAQSSLFSGAVHEPQMFSELKKEIMSSNRIDMLVSFVKWSGLRLIIDELRSFTQNGGILRIITTSYMGATDIKAIDELELLPNTEIKISYDTKRTRLHAKTYVFYRDTGFTTAYVGSSNLSNAAISSGLEWNVKVTECDQPDVLQKISATFESYWNSSEFELFNKEEHPRLYKALKAEKYREGGAKKEFFFDIRPYPYQQEILDRLSAEREVRHRFRNLVVAATGTGKTVIAAFDYRNFRKPSILRSSYRINLVLKPEYSDKLASISGDIGYEYSYVPHKIINIDKTTGLFETERIENGPGDEFVKAYIGQGFISETREFDYSGGVLRIANSQVCKKAEYYYMDTCVSIYDSDEIGIQYLYYPEEINILSINGELELRK